MTEITTDLLIVGCGIAGGLIAEKLAGEMDVLMIDAGPEINRASMVDAYQSTGTDPYPRSDMYPRPVMGGDSDYFVQAGPDLFKANYLKAVGGTTWMWLGTSLRFVPDDFRMKTRFGLAVDWPYSYEDLEPHYLAAEHAMAVAGNSEEDLGSPRSGPFPMPEIPQTYLDRVLTEALAGTKYLVQSTPQARNSQFLDNRPACCGSTSCVPICPTAAKYDATIPVYSAQTKGAGLMASTVAVRLIEDAQGRISGVDFKRGDGSSGVISAKVVVLAANAMEIPRLLLNSATEGRPNGFANSSDMVGRNLMDHPSKLSYALSREPLYPFRGPISTSGIETFRAATDRDRSPCFRIEISNEGWNRAGLTPMVMARKLAEEGIRGTELHAELNSRISRQITLVSVLDQLPDPENRIVLDPERKDAYGVPLPRISYRIDDYVNRGLDRAEDIHSEIFQKLDVTEIHHVQEFASACHIMGTARMGDDPDTSVVTPDLLSHDHDNLFIVGSAPFPTGSASNPSLTIGALSLKAVDPIRKRVAQLA